MTLELIITLTVLFYIQMAVSSFLVQQSEIRMLKLLQLSKTARGRSLLAVEKADSEKNILLRSLLWPVALFKRNDKKAKK